MPAPIDGETAAAIAPQVQDYVHESPTMPVTERQVGVFIYGFGMSKMLPEVSGLPGHGALPRFVLREDASMMSTASPTINS